MCSSSEVFHPGAKALPHPYAYKENPSPLLYCS